MGQQIVPVYSGHTAVGGLPAGEQGVPHAQILFVSVGIVHIHLLGGADRGNLGIQSDPFAGGQIEGVEHLVIIAVGLAQLGGNGAYLRAAVDDGEQSALVVPADAVHRQMENLARAFIHLLRRGGVPPVHITGDNRAAVFIRIVHGQQRARAIGQKHIAVAGISRLIRAKVFQQLNRDKGKMLFIVLDRRTRDSDLQPLVRQGILQRQLEVGGIGGFLLLALRCPPDNRPRNIRLPPGSRKALLFPAR